MYYVLKQSILRHVGALTVPRTLSISPRLWAMIFLILTQIIIIVAGIVNLTAQDAPAPTDLRVNPDGTASISGLVLSRSRECRIDTACTFFLRIKPGKTVRITYHPGEGTVPCAERLRTAAQLEQIGPGTEITAFGRYETYQGQPHLNICAIPEAYLTITHQP